MNNYSFAYERL